MTASAPAAEQELQLLHVPLVDIEEHPANPRHDVGNVDDLAASIGQVGVLEPVLVAPAGVVYGLCKVCAYVHQLDEHGDLLPHRKSARAKIDCPGTGSAPTARRDRWRLLAGHRRLAAARQAGLETVPAIARPDIAGDPEQLAAMLAENLQRVQLTPVEEAEGYDQLRLFGWKADQIADGVGRPKGTVQKRLRLAKLPQSTRDRLHAHELTLDVAEKLVEFADDPALLARLEREVGGYNFDYEVQRARRARQQAKERAKVEKQLAAAGVRVIPIPKNWGLGGGMAPVERPVVDVVGPVEHDPAADWRATEEKAVADHASCPNHAAIVGDNPARPVYVCTDPTVHADWEQRTDRPRVDPEQAHRRAEDQRKREELSTASDVRLAFVRQLMAGQLGPDRLLPLVRRAVVHRVTVEYQSDDRLGRVLELLGVELPSAKKRRKQTLLDWIDSAPSVAALTKVFLAFDVDRYECDEYGTNLRSPYGWTRGDGQGRDWLGHLAELGYEPSDFERSLLTPPPSGATSGDPDAVGHPDVQDDDVDEDAEQDAAVASFAQDG